MRIAINGVGIAGPTLAYWLRKSGHEILLIEKSPRLRSGGYAIDFWGAPATTSPRRWACSHESKSWVSR